MIDHGAEAPLILNRLAVGPEDLIEAIRNARFEAKQLGRASASSVLEQIRLPNTCIDSFRAGMPTHFQGAMPVGAYTFVFVDECPEPSKTLTFSMMYGAGDMGFFPPGADVDVSIPVGYVNASLTVPSDRLLLAVESCYPELHANVLRNGAGVRLSDPDAARIRRVLRTAREFLASRTLLPQTALRALEKEILSAYLEALVNACGRPSSVVRPISKGRTAMVRRATDLISERTQQLYLADLCRELGVSRRTVENLFRDLLNTSPSHYLRVAKLHAVRKALLAKEPAPGLIKQEAYASGFLHLGHFSRAYRDLFGETPTATLSRGRFC